MLTAHRAGTSTQELHLVPVISSQNAGLFLECVLQWKHIMNSNSRLVLVDLFNSVQPETITIKTFLRSLFLSSGVAGLRGSFTLSRGAGEEVRWSILAGVLALLGRLLGVDGLPRVDEGLGEAAGLGEAVLPLGVAGDDGCCLDKGLGLEERKGLKKSIRLVGILCQQDS